MLNFYPTQKEIQLLETVEADDHVVISFPAGLHGSRWETRKVSRVTEKQIIVGDYRFWQNSGREVGNKYDGALIFPATEERLYYAEQRQVEQDKKRRRNIAINKIWKTYWRDLDTETLERIVALVESQKGEQCS